MENLELNQPEEEPCQLVSARHIDGKTIKELDFGLLADLVEKRKLYKQQKETVFNIESIYYNWRVEMQKNPRNWHVFCWKSRCLSAYKTRKSERLARIPKHLRPKNEIPLTLEAGKALYEKLRLADLKLEHLKQNYYKAVEQCYREGFGVTKMAKAIGINASALRREMRRNMEWYGLARVRHHPPVYIWDRT